MNACKDILLLVLLNEGCGLREYKIKLVNKLFGFSSEVVMKQLRKIA
jgi:hypothetical protein